jgi:hypothetical protein
MMLMMQSGDLGFKFAWDPGSQGLYCLNPDGGKHEQIAGSVTSPEMAKYACDMWCKGYRSRAREITRRPGAKHYHMLAETGHIGVDAASVRPPIIPAS